MYATITNLSVNETREAIEYAAVSCGLRAVFNGAARGRKVAFTLALGAPVYGKARRYQRKSPSFGANAGRKVNAVCWHGHEAVMRALFERFDISLTIESHLNGVTKYGSLADFN